MTRSKFDWHYFVALLVVAVLQLCSQQSAYAQDNPKPATRSGDDKPVIYGPNDVIQDYHKRFPHAKEHDNQCWKGLEDNTIIPQQGSELKLKSVDETAAKIPPGKLQSQKAKKCQSGDKFCGLQPATAPQDSRPQYWGLLKPCGKDGFMFPPVMPGGPENVPCPTGPGPIIKQHAKNCSGSEGCVVPCRPPNLTDIPCYYQPALFNKNKDNLSKEGDQCIWEYELTTLGVGPISDTQYQMIERENNQRFLELMFDPERWSWTGRAAMQTQQQQASSCMAQGADHNFTTAVDEIQSYLINVANENAAEPVSGNPPQKTKGQVIYMVQQMYKQVYIPMAILLLLPGAVMTQMKSMVQFGVLKVQDETTDTNSPFMGIIRSIIAIFLIPATQLIVSYMIDVGNSLTYEVKKYIKTETIMKYAREQMYDPKIKATTNVMQPSNIPPLGTQPQQGGGEGQDNGQDEFLGKAAHGDEKKTVEEMQSKLSQQTNGIFNFMNGCLSSGLTVLTAFQLVMMCYLFLLGPIAAALYAWPNINKGSDGPGLFNKVFANWLDAVVVLSLWRFWWCVVLVTMTTYIEWSQELGFFDPTNQWEQMVFTAFQVLLGYVPFQPFNFSPKPMVEQIEKQAKESGKQGGQQPGGQSPGGQSPGGQSPGGTTPGGTTPGGTTPGGGNPPSGPGIAATAAPTGQGGTATPTGGGQGGGPTPTSSNSPRPLTITPTSGGGRPSSSPVPAVPPPVTGNKSSTTSTSSSSSSSSSPPSSGSPSSSLPPPSGKPDDKDKDNEKKK
ncbi:MAG: hypothetical protein K2W95_27105 [Candidatus Obscuribacterales bacterium]|nr:hypothetical protein [Candidatus Obscuribacterales bacterium]